MFEVNIWFLNIIGLRPSSRLYLSHIMHELFATGCEETMFNIVLNMHELFDAGHNETMRVKDNLKKMSSLQAPNSSCMLRTISNTVSSPQAPNSSCI
jgi:hypothetical protein